MNTRHENSADEIENYSERTELKADHSEEKTADEKLNENHRMKKNAENAVPPKAWINQEKAYNDAWENNKNQMTDDDV